MMTRREWLIFGLVALVGAVLLTRGLSAQPGYTDAFYHYNAAERLVTGQGLTDAYLWVYTGLPESLPAPSHLYWMPITSLVSALGMAIFGVNYAAAQIPLALLLAGTVLIAFWLGMRLGGGRRHAWIAGLMTLMGGFFLRFWGATDTFVPYAFVGALCLVFMGQALETKRGDRWRIMFWVLAGMLAALGHLTRADGLLLLVVGWVVILWPARQKTYALSLRTRFIALGVFTLAYLLVMLPWFLRNLDAIGSPLPLGGTQGIWYTEYNDLFNYPPDASPEIFFADGIGLLIQTRWDALLANLQTFIAVEGLVVIAPLMLVALWRRRTMPFLRGFWLYALGVHLAMTFVFPFPGVRGGLFHSVAALFPWWMALGIAGLDEVIEWIAKRRRTWRPGSAKVIFSVALLLIVVLLSLTTALPRRVGEHTPRLYNLLTEMLPDNARVMINDPAQLYYFTGYGGVVLPNETPETILTIARMYKVDYLVIEGVTQDNLMSSAAPQKLWPVLTDEIDFLQPLEFNLPGVKLYEILR